MRLVILSKAGEPGRIAINPNQVTHLRAGPGNFVDVFFAETKVAVAGTFEEVVNALCGEIVVGGPQDPAKAWFTKVQP
ncbi:MAG TPA: hypothetical protein VHM92_08150 [Allosphingosinicella sp.]|nr:hypothetical protein [Allosphingosinicella sp.]